MIEIGTSKPHPARMYDWYLDGKDTTPSTRPWDSRCSPWPRASR